MKQLILLFLLLIGTIVFTAYLRNGGKIPTPAINQREESYETLKIGGKMINVEIAKTPEEQEKGLSNRDSLAQDAGMLFVVAQNSQPIFFMRGMKFPLDIIWINDDKVIGASENLLPPPKNTSQDKLILYRSPGPVDYVLEVNGGFVKENKITPDTKIELPKSLHP